MSRRSLAALCLLGALAPAAGCGRGTAPPEAPGLRVAVSVPPQAWLVERIAGERAQVEVMIPPGVSPDTYEPSPRQLVALSQARLYLLVGHPAFPFERVHLEPTLRRHPGLSILSMAQAAEEEGIGAPEGEEDPHLWLSPRVVRATLPAVAAALERLEPAHRGAFATNLASALAEVDGLDRELHERLDPFAGRGFLVYHPAWGWLARDYGLRQIAVESGGKEPSLARLARLIEESRGDGRRVVYVQQGFSDRGARVIAQELGARVEVLDPLDRDWPGGLRRAAAALEAGF